nr:hypothetical protein [Candidatus Cyanaurora vandensis]
MNHGLLMKGYIALDLTMTTETQRTMDWVWDPPHATHGLSF